MTIIKFNKLLILLTGLAMCSYSYAGNWRQADLEYTQQIDGKDYLAKVTLLRPEAYFIKNNAAKRGDKLTVDLPEMGLNNVAMKIMAIKPFKGIPVKESDITTYRQIDETSWDNKTNRPVTGTFARYAKEVYTYKFKNSKTGEISSINATPNHPFYVVNKHDYVPIAKVTAGDELLSQAGDKVKLLCSSNGQTNCGIRYNTDNKPTLVYNFEVYQQHRYFVSNKISNYEILVHNPYDKFYEYKTLNQVTMQEGGINLLQYVEMNGSAIVERNHSKLSGIVTSGLGDCSAVVICTKNKILFTHLAGSNPDYFGRDFAAHMEIFASDEMREARAIIYSPSISNPDNYNRVVPFDELRSLDEEHYIIDSIGDYLHTMYEIPKANVRGVYHQGGSHMFGAIFSKDNKVLFGEIVDNVHVEKWNMPIVYN